MADWLGTEVADPLLILPPIGVDMDGATRTLSQDGIDCRIFADFSALCAAIGDEAGAVLVADEALAAHDLAGLEARLRAQPEWSDLPFIVLTGEGAADHSGMLELQLSAALRNVVFLQRPLNRSSLISVARSVVQARRRQRQVGQYLAGEKLAAAALRESEARFRNMADSAPVFIWMTDAAGQITFINLHHEYILGPVTAAACGTGWTALVHPDDQARHRAAFLAAFRARAPFRTEARVRDKTGQLRWLRCDGVPRLDDSGGFLGYTGCNVDITEARLAADELESHVAARTAELSTALGQLHGEVRERERIETALRQAHKMEAIGQLAGGIAHDFNNMLQAIASNLELMQMRIEEGQPEEAGLFVEAVHGMVERAATLTHRLLAFGRRQALKPKAFEPDGLVQGLVDLIRRTVGPQIGIHLSLADGAWTVLCDPNQLENVLLNVVINARDAMPDGGQLRITVANTQLTAADLEGQEGVAAGDYVEIAVTDSGTGMPPDVLARAFEPFFTTKPIGQGTGLGLSQIHGFVRQSKGAVKLESVVGEGTTVRLYLPRQVPATVPPTLAHQQPAPMAERTGGTVLVVEDEVSIRQVVAKAIRRLGYRVLEAGDGPAGLRLLQSREKIDLLLTDVGLPGLNGRQLADAGREWRPDLPVLLITGYAGSALADWRLEPGMEVISKPFTLKTLLGRVAAMLKEGDTDPIT